MDDGPSDELEAFLDRVRWTFDVPAATIGPAAGTGIRAGSGDRAVLPFLEGGTAFCRHAIAGRGLLVVADAAHDGRFRSDARVAGHPRIRFYAGLPLRPDRGAPVALLGLFDTRPRRLSLAQARRLAEMAESAVPLIARRRDAAAMAGLRAELAAHGDRIRSQAAALAHGRSIFERASAAARIGVWECDLHDESLQWTDSVYDMFEIPRASPLHRRQTLAYYTDESLAALDAIRSRAIAERGGFNLDAEITTAKGRRRWIRLTATVESVDGAAPRIFGMKQDITEEKIQADRTRYLAEYDAMTGLANRGLFQARLAQLRLAGPGNPVSGALLLVDLDGFKQINDTFGHALGDECLKTAARRLRSVCREADLVARIGGDEFAVLLGGRFDRNAIETVAGRIVATLRRSVERGGRSSILGASVGVAMIEGCLPTELFARADTALYAAKAAGRNTFRIFRPVMAIAALAPRHAALRAPGAIGR